MWQWLQTLQSTIYRRKTLVKAPPKTLLHTAHRAVVTQVLSDSLAVDVSESSLFYRSIEGKVICRSIVSGDIRWESIDDAYPLRVSDKGSKPFVMTY
ncbi:hypothetical protein [Leptolyngbya sp. FACHB-16]|uniref:hypothetical protein n=1 Tax=unclassified Leptolyngbya TaxID=2650499 RepID=UPI0016894CF2|nr:hypothetical protein [Leptolyngbya sp. FACHB-16]MBD2155680.1 hypothetical protein [Leptolyngbya sp. FACHB-16]